MITWLQNIQPPEGLGGAPLMAYALFDLFLILDPVPPPARTPGRGVRSGP